MHETAHAKINLFLDVIGRRPDGYHTLHSCMQTVGLADTVTADFLPKEPGVIRLSCSDPTLPCGESNLVYRAAKLYRDHREMNHCGVHLHIEKRIPLSAGLGGGSADAAAVLRLLNRHAKTPLPEAELCALGAKLGADVPFCITGGTCRCEGIGELLSHVKTKPDYTVLVAKDGEGVSTPEAFALLDRKYENFTDYQPRDPQAIYRTLAGGDVRMLAGSIYNIFEDVIFPVRPKARNLKETMLACGALCAQMSGSGPSVFGIFDSDARATVCAATLQRKGIFAVACRTVE